MDEIHHIKQCSEDGLSISAIARKFHKDRRTVRNAVNQDLSRIPNPIPRKRAKKGGDALMDWLEDQLRSNLAHTSGKDRATATRLHRILLQRDNQDLPECNVSRRTLARYIDAVMQEIQASKPRFIRLTHPAGQAQVDFGKVHVIWLKSPKALHVLILTLPQSNARFACLLPAENFECVAKGLTTIFVHMGGIPPVIRFDNMSTAIARVFRPGDDLTDDVHDAEGHPRKLTDSFKRLMYHYRFRAEFCNTAAGNEKGSVENAVGWIRNNVFNPTVSIRTDLDEFNRSVLLPFCDKSLQEKHYLQHKSIRELYENDRNAFLPMPKQSFEGATWVKAVVNNYSQVTVDGNSYQVDCSSGTPVWVKKTADHITVYNESNLRIGFWPRSYDQNCSFIDWVQHVRDLVRKPTAYRNSLLRELMSTECDQYILHLRGSARSALLSVLAGKLQKASPEDVLTDLSKAIRQCRGLPDSDVLCCLRGIGERTANEMPELEIPQEWDIRLSLPDFAVYGETGHA